MRYTGKYFYLRVSMDVMINPLVGGGRIYLPFHCVSYEATKSASTAWDYAGLLCNLYSLGWRDRDADQ